MPDLLMCLMLWILEVRLKMRQSANSRRVDDDLFDCIKVKSVSLVESVLGIDYGAWIS